MGDNTKVKISKQNMQSPDIRAYIQMSQIIKKL